MLAVLSVRCNGSGKYKIKCLRSTRQYLEDAFEITPSKQTTATNCGFIVVSNKILNLKIPLSFESL